MEELLKRQNELEEELEDLVKREEIYIHLLPSLLKEESDGIESDLRQIRTQRQDVVTKLNEVKHQIKKLK